jgi:hypothetical protein
MVAVALLIILQSLRFGWFGSGYLCPPVVSAIYLPSAMAAAANEWGLGGHANPGISCIKPRNENHEAWHTSLAPLT